MRKLLNDGDDDDGVLIVYRAKIVILGWRVGYWHGNQNITCSTSDTIAGIGVGEVGLQKLFF